MHDGLLVIDADAHKMENPVVFFDYLDAPYRDRLGSRTDRYGQPRLIVRDRDPRTGAAHERVFPQPDGPGKGAFAAIHPETALGGVFNRIRLEHMDREGVDAAELDVALGVHGSPGVYLPSGVAEQVDTFILSHIFGHRNQMQMALSACVFDGVFDRFPTLRMAFLEAGCGWLPDLVHAFHEHWEKRIRDLDPGPHI